MKELINESGTAKFYWDNENDIVWIELFANITSVENVIDNIDAQERLCKLMNKKKTRVLTDITSVDQISKDARDYFANERTASIQRATLLLIGSPVSRVMGTFFLGLNKQITPTKLFTDPKEAIKWLHTFSDE